MISAIKTLFVAACLFLSSTAAATQVKIDNDASNTHIKTEKVATIYGVVDFKTLFLLNLQLATTKDLPGDRVLLINSPGGMVTVGIDMLDMLHKDVEASHSRLICVVMGNASSMAFNILSLCDVRLAIPKSKMVVHKVAISEMPPGMRLTAKNLRRVAADMDIMDAPFRQINAAAMHLSLSEYDRYADQETAWSVEELIKRGYLHGILDVKHGN